MAADKLYARYARLDAKSRHVLQVCALTDEVLNRQDLTVLSSQSGWTDRSGKRLTKKDLGQLVDKLVRQDLLRKGAYSNVRVNPDVQDLAVQDSIRGDWFETLCETIVSRRPTYAYGRERTARDLRFAFYQGDVAAYRTHLRGKKRGQSIRLLDPFSRDIFDRLDPLLRELYLADAAPRAIAHPEGSQELLTAFDEWIDNNPSPDDDFLAAWLDVAVARGDLESLDRLVVLTGRRLPGAALCTSPTHGGSERR